ncbi:MAG: ABC transporter ATP-binding protein [bacterium]
MDWIVRTEDVKKTYPHGTRPVEALRGVDLEVREGEALVIMGPSGSGKSTLLNLLGCLDVPSSGEIWLEGTPLSDLDDDQRTLLRRRRVGMVFQFYNLLPSLSALENAALPLLLDGRDPIRASERAGGLLEGLGLGHRLDHRPDELSGGEMQRVAIARALGPDPAVLLADEPTGNLDSATGEEVLELLLEAVRTRGHTLVVVTHDPQVASHADRLLTMRDGLLVDPPEEER